MHSIHIVRVNVYGPGNATLMGLDVSVFANFSSWTAKGRLLPSRPKTAGCRTSVAGTSSESSSFANFIGIVNQGKEVGKRNELAVVQQASDETGIAVAPLLTIGDHVHRRA